MYSNISQIKCFCYRKRVCWGHSCAAQMGLTYGDPRVPTYGYTFDEICFEMSHIFYHHPYNWVKQRISSDFGNRRCIGNWDRRSFKAKLCDYLGIIVAAGKAYEDTSWSRSKIDSSDMGLVWSFRLMTSSYFTYRKVSNIRRTKYQNLNSSRFI